MDVDQHTVLGRLRFFAFACFARDATPAIQFVGVGPGRTT